MRSPFSTLSKNIVYNLSGQLLLLIAGLIAVRFVFRQLGEDALGIIYFTMAFNGVLCAVLDMGVSSTTVREMSSKFASEPAYINDFIRTASSLYWGGFVLTGILFYFSAPLLVEKWIHLKTLDAAGAVTAVRILGIAGLTALPRSLYASLFRGLQRMEFNNAVDAITSIIQQCGTIVILSRRGGLFQVVVWFAACFGMSILAYLLISSRFFAWRQLMPGYSSQVVARNIAFVRQMMAFTTLGMIHTQSDKMIVAKLLPIGLAGYYGFASGLVSKTMLLTGAISQAAFPSFSALSSSHSRELILKQYYKLQDLVCIATVPLFAALIFAALPLFSYVFNPEIARMLLVPVAWLCLGYYLNGALNIPFVISVARGHPQIWARCNLLALFIVLPVAATLVVYFGLAGAGFSWVFYHLFAYSYAVPRVCSECLGIPARQWYGHLGRIAALVLATYGLTWLAMGLLGSHSIATLAVGYLAATAVFLSCGYSIATSELKQSLAQAITIFRPIPHAGY